MATGTYKITMLTFTSPVTMTSGQQPFKPAEKFSATQTKVTQIEVLDDDGTFDTISRFYYEDKTFQTLAAPAEFQDGKVTAAGARLGVWSYTRIEELEDNQPTGNFFYALFPRHFKNEYGSNDLLGNQHSVLIIPAPKVNAAGDTAYPVFDRTATYQVREHIQISQTNSRLTYAPQCFTTGTLIECDSGPRRIETIRPGDLVRTRDNGLRRVRWIGGRTLDAAALDLNPALRPIRIRVGALGNGLPRRDLTVSPQHRVLVQSTLTRQLCGEPQVLVAAKHLTDIDGIEVVRTATDVTYWHMLLDGHELVRSNGAWTETLYTGPEAMKSLAPAARREILTLFPELANGEPISPPARPFLKGRDGRKIARHHARQSAELVEM
ncbi:Hint domain-containing protein [Paracoccus sp. Z118]|uniref:Hint domain-containing protein n=1 Tax=Paracoccus sp. Z118 TaxID=2851017 RepID=UPI001C2C4BFE|nr:Hint domain-containing protein [Paracoccus sp. Z118]MBV0891948.1 Hint domain-containing protein [Paracoccus sp. Z118]